LSDFRLVADFKPTGDQPDAIDRLSDGLARGLRHQTLLGATGTGKTATIAWTIERHQKPTLVLAHNKTLAAQLYSEFRDFFPDNAVEYYVSYFDYYQPEAYLPRSDTYIEKDSSRNDEIDKLRHAATKALFERRDVIIVASVSCIYGLGAPIDYGATILRLRVGGAYRRDSVLRHLVDLQYQRNDQSLTRARFRVRGDTLELVPASEDTLVRVEFFGDEVERITELDGLTGELLAERRDLNVYPATHYVTPHDKLQAAIKSIDEEMEQRVSELEGQGRDLEAARLRQRTTFDLEMMRELGYCTGIENYSRHLAGRAPGSRPWTLLDYFPPDWLLVVDESHMSIPQVVGMYKNDRTRKEILVDFGFRLPSALDNRPLTFEEFEASLNQVVYMSATPGPYELERSQQVVEQLIRPTGVVDPKITVKPTEGQIDDLLELIRGRVERGERAIVTTLTKKMAEDLADYLHELGVKVQYLHSEVDTLERVQILRDLRLGVYDVVVGINLLREGIDLPEVTLVAILDADKEGFLRSAWSLIQMIGRAARNVGGEVVMYADGLTDSMKAAIDETNRRRAIQDRYNHDHGIEPTTVVKEIHDINDRLRAVAESGAAYGDGGGPGRARDLSVMGREQVEKLVTQMEAEMRQAARELEFERAAALRDEIQEIRLRVLEEDASAAVAKAAEKAARGRPAAGTAGAGGASGDRLAPARSGRLIKPVRQAAQAARRAAATGGRAGERELDAAALDVTDVRVVATTEADETEIAAGELAGAATAADWLPGIRDEHEEEGWAARWIDRPTWDHTVTPNVIKRTGQRPTRGGRRR
jgi:excinuclease ABC subunit B